MKRFKSLQVYLAFMMLILSVFIITGCGSDNQTGHWLGTGLGTEIVTPPVTPPDATRPTVVSMVPVDVATGVCVNQVLTATFDEAMLASTITATGTFTVKETISSADVPGIVTYDAGTLTVTFTPTAFFTASLNYTAMITTAATDLAGNALAVDKVWTFTTGATVCAPPPAGSCDAGALPLGSAASYAVLAGTSFTFADPQVITGDVGSPSVTPAAFGLSSTHIGTLRDAGTDPAPGAIQTAVSDMQTAVGCATDRDCDFNYGAATDFAALPQPLAAGHYCVTGAMSVGAPLTLTNSGVYIFQSTGALDTAVGPFAVRLGGSANAENTFVYWVPGGITTIQADVAFLGSILSYNAAITLNANATLIGGRALSGAAVNSLSTNTIAIPIP